jgi:hypothetical protein
MVGSPRRGEGDSVDGNFAQVYGVVPSI